MIDKLSTWIFVDDAPEEAAAFAAALTSTGKIKVDVLGPKAAREQLLTGAVLPGGVLMDVDLSNAVDEHGTGPGIAQDLRVKQRSGAIREFPIVRFAGADRVRKNILGDPTSDDLFDAKIPKERLHAAIDTVCTQLAGVEAVYRALAAAKTANPMRLEGLVGLDKERWQAYGHPVFEQRVIGSSEHSIHVAAGIFLKSFLYPAGLLIDEPLLAVRLGIDAEKSSSYAKLRDSLGFVYTGAASTEYRRWWARALDDWWFTSVDSTSPPSSLTADVRVRLLSDRLGIEGLIPLQMPAESAGSKPWRLCTLHLEKEPAEIIPVDPAESVRMTGYADASVWQDPQYAALQIALGSRHDARLNAADLAKLFKKHVKK